MDAERGWYSALTLDGKMRARKQFQGFIVYGKEL